MGNFQPPKDALEAAAGRRGPTPEERFKRQETAMPQPPARQVTFGPPDFGDEDQEESNPKYTNRDQVRANYAGFNPDEEDDGLYEDEEPGGFNPELEEQYDDEESGFNPPPAWMGVGEMPTPPSLRQRGGGFTRDEPIFEGGPTRSEISAWKKQFEEDGHGVFLTEVGDTRFVWRTLNRAEYREIMALPNTDPLQREEIICEVCTLFPYQYNFAAMASRKAGVPAVLAEQIMNESGFKRPTPPVRL